MSFKDDSAADKAKKLHLVSQNSYDVVLMSEPVFQSIELDPDTELGYMQDIAGKHVTAESGYKRQNQLESKKADLASRRTDKTDALNWEALGIDCLIQDEAHHLKNLFQPQANRDTAFLSTGKSDRSLDFFYKSQFTKDKHNNQNVYLLTATPTTNNPVEAFNMLQYICPEEFERRGIDNIDDFLQVFGRVEETEVPGVDGNITKKNGLIGFKNLNDLRQLFTKYCRMQTAKEVNLPIPEEVKIEHHIDMSPEQQRIYDSLRERAKELKEHPPDKDDPDKDHVFSIIADMDKAALDLDYYQRNTRKGESVNSAANTHSPKIVKAVQNIMASRTAHNGKQILFCEAKEMHESLKQQLVKAGYPEEEIAIVNASTVPKSSDRQNISQQFNRGKYTLVIGNNTMSEGMNFQEGTTDIHHLNLPWTPAEINQKNGRGVRQGNRESEVSCHYYYAKGSFDAYRNTTLQRKRSWLTELWKGNEDSAINQNTGRMSSDEIEIALSSNPEEARKAAEANQALKLAKFQDEQRQGALGKFKRLEDAKQAYSRLSDEAKQGKNAQKLLSKIAQLKDTLRHSEYFDHKDALEDSNPILFLDDNQFARVGDMVQVTDGGGGIVKIVSVDPKEGKVSYSVVHRKASPFLTQRETEAVMSAPLDKFKSKAQPTVYDAATVLKDKLEAFNDYGKLRHFTPDEIDTHKEQFEAKLRDSYSFIPVIKPSGKVALEMSTRMLPEDRILYPSHPEALDLLIDSWAEAKATQMTVSNMSFRSVVETMTGKNWGDMPELEERLNAKTTEKREAAWEARRQEDQLKREQQAASAPYKSEELDISKYTSKNPWEMSEDEWKKSIDEANLLESSVSKYTKDSPRVKALTHLSGKSPDSLDYSTSPHLVNVPGRGKYSSGTSRRLTHKEVVEAAMRSGKEVPVEVLKHHKLGRYADTPENNILNLREELPHLSIHHTSESIGLGSYDRHHQFTVKDSAGNLIGNYHSSSYKPLIEVLDTIRNDVKNKGLDTEPEAFKAIPHPVFEGNKIHPRQLLDKIHEFDRKIDYHSGQIASRKRDKSHDRAEVDRLHQQKEQALSTLKAWEATHPDRPGLAAAIGEKLSDRIGGASPVSGVNESTVQPIDSSTVSLGSPAPSVNHNKAQSGVEINFPGKPSPATISRLKENGFRWSPRNKVWYAKFTPQKLELAHTIAEDAHQDLNKSATYALQPCRTLSARVWLSPKLCENRGIVANSMAYSR
ncbi:MAG: SNF2-related protein [Desertifilum sp.]|nr:SNF2-related protein [Desertifilum sp.]